MESEMNLPDGFHTFRVPGQLQPCGVTISEYISLVKARKIIRSLSDIELSELNNSIFAVRPNQHNMWTREKLLSKLELLDHVQLLRFLFVREKESLMDAMLCLLNKKKFKVKAHVLVNYFKYGTALKTKGDSIQ
jgi:hypothetical protein